MQHCVVYNMEKQEVQVMYEGESVIPMCDAMMSRMFEKNSEQLPVLPNRVQSFRPEVGSFPNIAICRPHVSGTLLDKSMP